MTRSELAVLQLIGAGIGVAVAFRLVSGHKLQELEQMSSLLSVFLLVAPAVFPAADRR